MSKAKGSRWERNLIEHLADMYGIEAERVPLSGALGGRHCHDVVITDGVWEGKRFEVKYRKGAAGFSRLYEYWGAGVLMPNADMFCAMNVADALDAAGTWDSHVRGEFKTLDKWMGTADVLALRAARKPWLFVYRKKD